VDLAALPVGQCENGTPWLLRVISNHVLIAGATGAGKAR
jgi:DNA segregation ATPase FtsK/SpoIIIE, S-DNA-T family